MKTYVLVTLKENFYTPSDRETFEQSLRLSFPSYDYLMGFIDGYGLGKIKVKSLDEFTKMHNKLGSDADFLIYFATIIEHEDD